MSRISTRAVSAYYASGGGGGVGGVEEEVAVEGIMVVTEVLVDRREDDLSSRGE